MRWSRALDAAQIAEPLKGHCNAVNLAAGGFEC